MSQEKNKYRVGLWKTLGLVAVRLISPLWVMPAGRKAETTKDTKVHEGKSRPGNTRVLCGF